MKRFIRIYRNLFPDGSDVVIDLMESLAGHIGCIDDMPDHDIIAMIVKIQALLTVGESIFNNGCSDTDRLLINHMIQSRVAYAN